MEIVDFGFFHLRDPDPAGPVMLFFENEEGQDWYELRFALTDWEPATGKFINAVYGAWAMVDADGVVTNVEYDPSRLMPGDRRILGIDASHRDIRPGMLYRDGALQSPIIAEEPE
jgi:hypothetical protein